MNDGLLEAHCSYIEFQQVVTCIIKPWNEQEILQDEMFVGSLCST